MGVRLGHRWRSKPPLGSGLDASHPLAGGLALWWPLLSGGGTLAADLSGFGRHGAIDPALAWGSTPAGPGLVGPALFAANYVSTPAPAISTPFSASVRFRAGAVDSNTRLLLCNDDPGTTTGWQIWFTSSGVVLGYRGLANTPFSGLVPVAGHLHTLAFSATFASVTGYLFDETAGAVASQTVAMGFAPGAGATLLRALGSSVATGATGSILTDARIWTRALAPAEVSALHADPYGPVLAPATRRFLAPSGGGTPGNASGTAPAASLSAPTGAATGAGSAAGTAPALSARAPAGTATGGVSATGSAPVLSTSAPAGTATGAASATGTAPALSLSAPAGSASGGSSVPGNASGAAPALSLSAPTGTATGAGSAVGTAPIVSISAPAGTATGSASAAGTAPGLALRAPAGTASGGGNSAGPWFAPRWFPAGWFPPAWFPGVLGSSVAFTHFPDPARGTSARVGGDPRRATSARAGPDPRRGTSTRS